jgi:formamidopyrimidine-DNA glycosylase
VPELPEVESIARELDSRLRNAVFGRVHLIRPDIVREADGALASLISRRRIVQVYRRAKRIMFELSPPTTLVFHLGMSGRLTLSPKSESVESHTHLRIGLSGRNEELRFRDPRRFGGVWCFDGPNCREAARLGSVGPEPLTLTFQRFKSIVHRARQIKAMLMDQRVVAGLGNIYTDEALHAAGVHPQTRGDQMDNAEKQRLLRAVRATLRRAIRHKGSTLMDYRLADGSEGGYRRFHKVYDREGNKCHNCGTAIVRIMAAGRSSYFCPKCQCLRRGAGAARSRRR